MGQGASVQAAIGGDPGSASPGCVSLNDAITFDPQDPACPDALLCAVAFYEQSNTGNQGSGGGGGSVFNEGAEKLRVELFVDACDEALFLDTNGRKKLTDENTGNVLIAEAAFTESQLSTNVNGGGPEDPNNPNAGPGVPLGVFAVTQNVGLQIYTNYNAVGKLEPYGYDFIYVDKVNFLVVPDDLGPGFVQATILGDVAQGQFGEN